MNLLERYEAVGKAMVAVAEDSLTLRAPANSTGDGIRLSFTRGGSGDWSAATCLMAALRGNGAHRLRFHIEHGHGQWTFYLVPRPGLTSRFVLDFQDLQQRPANTGHPGYSQFGGGPAPVALADVRSLTITFNQVSPEEKTLSLSALALSSDTVPEPALLEAGTVIDAFGQWTGERGVPRSEAAIRAAWSAEPAAFTGFPGQTDATGAAAAAAMLPASEGMGFFRVREQDERWWLVDPDGFPFFSLGCDCVRAMSEGPVSGREGLFSDLSQAYSSGRQAGTLWADFYQRNLRLRYADDRGEEWRDAWAAQCRTRLRAWGFNTIANWSDTDLTRRGLMPYTTNVAALGEMCGHLPDVFAPGFAKQVRTLVEPEVRPYRGDRMLIGYFVGNEPAWTFGGRQHPFNDVWVSEEYPHTRAEAMTWLRQTYNDDLAAVNAAWKTAFTAWDDLTRGGESGVGVPDVRLGTDALKRDADAFMGRVLGAFYEIACREIRAVDPDHLLLGGRFYTPSMAEPYVRACRAFDVFSFNFYNWDAPKEAIERITRLTGRPVMIGEFHYGVEGRGLTASLVAVTSQKERGLAYRNFVENAAALPMVVGAHWFQWVDQPVTGRFDGECYNIGLVDITDIPYDDFLTHVRETHARLYDVCRGATAPYAYPGERPAAW